MHTSVKMNSPMELLQVTPLNSLISKCQIKVCYVGDQPNRNGSVITKEVATQLANSIPGSPIVGFFNEETGDFEEHNRELVVDKGEFYFKDETRPYGFVDLNAPVWFQKFLDDGIEHEYLMTEGYLWTGQYPEAKRVIERGNNQSMELDPNSTSGYWSKEGNEGIDFFIINEAIISKLCILGEDVEPCFEGASITNMQFSFNPNFKAELFNLMEEMKKILQEGGTSVEKEVKDVSLEAEQKELVAEESPVAPVEEPVAEEVKEELAEEKPAEVAEESVEAHEEEGEVPAEAEAAPEVKDEVTYNLNEIKEYVELSEKYSALESEYNNLKTSIEELNNKFAAIESEANELRTFKLGVERKDKEAMIARFYMLSDEDKADVVKNIDNYSLDDIEKELSVICFRNHVSFEPEQNPQVVTTFNLNSNDCDSTSEGWLKALRKVAKEMK